MVKSIETEPTIDHVLLNYSKDRLSGTLWRLDFCLCLICMEYLVPYYEVGTVLAI